MKYIMRSMLLLFILLITLPTADSETPPFVRYDMMYMNGALGAIMADDYEAFCATGTPELKTQISKIQFEELVSKLKPVLSGGFSADGESKIALPDQQILMMWLINFPDKIAPVLIRTKSKGNGAKLMEFKIEA